jgi:uncharacterized FAD-dependent dehydrogenase
MRKNSAGMEISMIRITELKLPVQHTKEDLVRAIAKKLKLPLERIQEYHIVRLSIDARKNEVKYIYSVNVNISLNQKEIRETEATVIKHCRNNNIKIADTQTYRFTVGGTQPLKNRPVVVGTGPAGLFCAWMLSKYGYHPLVIERGDAVEKRVSAVERFWQGDKLDPECNVQFGEGGAGTFSDGKLNTMVKDVSHRSRFVLETFAEHGAPSDILYLNKPHIGTDHLRSVVVHMRQEMLRMGAEIRFRTRLTDLLIENGKLTGIELNGKDIVPCEVLIPAIGHSARDTFSVFLNRGLELSPKAFAIGLRIEHKQDLISRAQYGANAIFLPPADYKLTHQTRDGRGVYSFCMCPGGFVVNASSEENHLAVNGMSNYQRDEENANSAIVVTVTPKDFGSTEPLSGITFQRKWEHLAFEAGKGKIPVQLFGDFIKDRDSTALGNITPNIKGGYRLANLTNCLPSALTEALKEGILAFDGRIKGFANEEAVLSGVESRTSSPVRIHRNETFESNIGGIYPCGEGAGYAGGITSAAVDGIKVFESVAARFCPNKII